MGSMGRLATLADLPSDDVMAAYIAKAAALCAEGKAKRPAPKPKAALDLPRVINMNGRTELEDKGDLPAEADALRKLGHDVQIRPHHGGLTAIRRKGDGWEGAADPRRDGVAKGD